MPKVFPSLPTVCAALVLLAACAPAGETAKAPVSKSQFAMAPSPTAKAALRVLTLGQSATGSLESGDPTLPDGSHYNEWLYEGQRGQRVRITMESNQFDPYLILLLLVDDGEEYVDEDDDSAGNLNARITAELPVDGTYLIVANSYGANEFGEYTLRIELDQ